jgi:cytochrome d ubiquinol oxidase subunit I
LRKPDDNEAASTMLRMALPFIAVLAIVQLIVGHAHGVNVHAHQPVKLAAIEGHWQSHAREAPLILLAWPDQQDAENAWAVALPAIGSLAVTGSFDGAIDGLRSWPASERPPVAVVFWSFRLMVGMGLLMLAIGVYGSWLLWRGVLAGRPGFLRLCVTAAGSGFVAILAGWVTAEVGRQPYVVQGLLRTADAVSPVSADTVGLSLLVFVCVYLVVFGAGLYYLLALVRRGPDDDREDYSGPASAQAALDAAPKGGDRGAGR